jgi:hypothetical protein
MVTSLPTAHSQKMKISVTVEEGAYKIIPGRWTMRDVGRLYRNGAENYREVATKECLGMKLSKQL